MSLPVLYLAGPIANCTDEECMGWRREVTKAWREMLDAEPMGAFVGDRLLDPMRRDYRGSVGKIYHEIVDLDKRDIRNCDVMLVNHFKPSIGTAMEMLYAWENEKMIILVNKTDWPDEQLSPWLLYHSTKIFPDFKSALEWIKETIW